MYRSSFLYSGIPHLIIAILLVSAISYYEQFILEYADNSSAILIASDTDDMQETSLVTKTSSHHQDLVQTILKKNDLETIATHPEVKSLSNTEQVSFFIELATTYAQAHRYSDATAILAKVELQERIKLGVQFLYAHTLAKNNQFEMAIKQYQYLIQAKPNIQVAQLNLAILLKKNDQCELAIPVFKQTIAISSGRKKAKAYSGLASCLETTEQYEPAIKAFIKSIEYRPNSAITWLKLAEAYSSNGQYNEALDSYNKSIALNPNNYKSHLKKARTQLSRYDIVGARQALEQAKRHTNNSEINELLAWILIEDGARNEARKVVAELLKNASTEKQEWHAQRFQQYINKDYAELIKELERKKKLDKHIFYLKGLTYRRLGYFDSANEIFTKLEANTYYQWLAKIQQMRIMRSRKQYQLAIEHYQSFLSDHRYAHALWFESALIYEKLKQFQLGVTNINNALEIEPDNKIYTLTKARLLQMAGKQDEAMALVQNLLSKKPGFIRGHKLMAELFLAENRHIDALNSYKEILTINPDDRFAAFAIARIYLQTDDHLSAQKVLNSTLLIHTNDTELRYLLAESLFSTGQYALALQEVDKLLRLEHNIEATSLRDNIISMINKE